MITVFACLGVIVVLVGILGLLWTLLDAIADE